MGQLMDQILSRGNMRLAYQKVKANKGARGVDGISIEEIDTYLVENWKNIKEKILNQNRKDENQYG